MPASFIGSALAVWVLASVTTAAPPQSARIDPSLPPLFGETGLRSGFRPDPVWVDVESAEGDVPVNSIRGAGLMPRTLNCGGYITQAPTHRLQYRAGRGYQLQFFADPAVDDAEVVLVVQAPNGQVYCHRTEWEDFDEYFETVVTISRAPTGVYNIWIGGPPQRVSLGFSEP